MFYPRYLIKRFWLVVVFAFLAVVIGILADHDGAPESICAHPDPADGDEASTILFAMVAEPAQRTLTIASGHACTGTFETFQVQR